MSGIFVPVTEIEFGSLSFSVMITPVPGRTDKSVFHPVITPKGCGQAG